MLYTRVQSKRLFQNSQCAENETTPRTVPKNRAIKMFASVRLTVFMVCRDITSLKTISSPNSNNVWRQNVKSQQRRRWWGWSCKKSCTGGVRAQHTVADVTPHTRFKRTSTCRPSMREPFIMSADTRLKKTNWKLHVYTTVNQQTKYCPHALTHLLCNKLQVLWVKWSVRIRQEKIFISNCT